MTATNRLLVGTWLAFAPMACGGKAYSTANGAGYEGDAAPLQDAGTGGFVTQGGSSSGSSGSSGGGAGSGGGGSSGGSDEAPADAADDALDETTVVEQDGATVTGLIYGNPVKFPTCIAGNGLIQSGYLFAAPVGLPSTGTVQGLGVIAEQSAVVTMALYALAPAGALALVTQTASTSISAGSNLVPTPPTALPGTGTSYWIAVEFQETTTVCADGWGALIQFSNEPYGTFPSLWLPTANTTGSLLNFFAVIN